MASNQLTLPSFDEANVTPATWRPAQESFFIELMIEKVTACSDNRVMGTFSKKEWVDIRKRYYQRFGLKYNLKAFKNKMNSLKERYKDHKKLLEGSTGLGWDPVLCTVSATNEWWDDYVKVNPRAKRFRIQGCPEYDRLALIFGDTIAAKPLQAAKCHDFNSTDRDDGRNGDLHGSVPSTPINNATGVGEPNEYREDQIRSCSCTPSSSTRCGKRDRRESEINETLNLLLEFSKTRVESRNKYTISECIEILDAMGPDIGGDMYMRAMKLLQEKGWRETFIRMSDERRKDWLRSIENGII